MKKDFEKLSRDILAQFDCKEVTDLYGKPTHSFGREFSEMVVMNDGVKLHTTIMLPDGKEAETYPAILIRNPYIALAHSSLYRFYNLYGYAVVYQEVRGKGRSGGDFAAWDNERFDGIDTVRWIEQQSWYNGELYLVGSSYTAFVHMTMLEDIMDQVKGAVLRVFTPDFRSALYENGVWHLDMITPWIINTEYDFMNDSLFYEKYTQALEIRPFEKAIDTVMGQSYPWHQEMITNSDEKSLFWSESHWGRMCSLPEKIKIPMLMIDGWYDPFCPGLLQMWDKIPTNVRKDCAMIIGPWVHDCVIQENCGFSMPHGEILGMDGSLGFLDWLNHIRFGTEPHLSIPGKIRYYVMGSDTWKTTGSFSNIESHENMPSGRKICRHKLFLDENSLTDCVPDTKALTYLYDPERPTSFWGGEYFNNFMPGGMMKQSKPFRRHGVLNFISEPFSEDMEITGYMDVFLKVASDCEETVFIARLDAVTEDAAWNVREGASLMSKGTLLNGKNGIYWLHIRLWPSAWHIKSGWRLRLDIASSNYPAYLPFGNTKEPWSKQTKLLKAHNTIFTGDESFIQFCSLR